VCIPEGISWVLKQEEQAIVLEDDTLPHADFFHFCSDILDRFQHNKSISAICGFDEFLGSEAADYSCRISRLFGAWGWATWRRAWEAHNVGVISDWPKIRTTSLLKDVLGERRFISHYREIFDAVFDNRIQAWDYQFQMTSWLQGTSFIFPTTNLIKNIGLGPDATNTKIDFFQKPNHSLTWPLRFPDNLLPNRAIDAAILKRHLEPPCMRVVRKTLRKLPFVETMVRSVINRRG
jgi:hypothetical protein